MFSESEMKVLVNQRKQYSIWPADRDHPLGWNEAGKVGSREECLTFVEQVWTALRPPEPATGTARTSGPRAAEREEVQGPAAGTAADEAIDRRPRRRRRRDE